MDIKGHAAIVTGGGSGLGAATARMLADAGAKVALLDVNMDAANAHAKAFGGIAIKCDVSDSASAEGAKNIWRKSASACRRRRRKSPPNLNTAARWCLTAGLTNWCSSLRNLRNRWLRCTKNAANIRRK